MIVVPHHDDTFLVSSADDADCYTVVWDRETKRIVCNCSDYRFRCQTELDKGKKMKPYHMDNRTLCKHCGAMGTFLWESGIASAFGVERTDIFEEHVA